jgi:hypothetical protein
VPKLKELEVGEGLSLGPTKQLEFTLRLETIIRTSTKKVFTQPLAFGDREENIGGKEILPHWGELFKKIIPEEFSECIPHNNPYLRKLDDEAFPNIRWLYLPTHGRE